MGRRYQERGWLRVKEIAIGCPELPRHGRIRRCDNITNRYSTRNSTSAASQLLAKQEDDIKALAKLVKRCKKTSNLGLTYVKLDLDSVRLCLLTDSSFANAEGHKSQLVFVLSLVDSTGNCNILHFGSSRCSRVTRSVMASEIFGLI